VVNPGSSGRTFFSSYTTPDRSFAAALRSSEQQHQQPSQQNHQQSSGHQVNKQTSLQSLQAKNVNSNVKDNMFIAFTMVQQIMAELSVLCQKKKRLQS
jgi:hypothetical protein